MYVITENNSTTMISDTLVPIRVAQNGCYVQTKSNPDGFTVMVPVTYTDQDGIETHTLETRVYVLPGHTLKGTEPEATYKEESGVLVIDDLEKDLKRADNNLERAHNLTRIFANEGMTANQRYYAGEYITVDGILYRVILPIMAGSFITPNTNVLVTTMENELENINKEDSTE